MSSATSKESELPLSRLTSTVFESALRSIRPPTEVLCKGTLVVEESKPISNTTSLSNAIGAVVSTVIVAVAATLVFPAGSVAVALNCSAPSPIAVTSASSTLILHSPAALTIAVPKILFEPSVNVIVSPETPVPVTAKLAAASVPLTILSPAIGSLIVGASGGVVSTTASRLITSSAVSLMTPSETV